MSEPAVIFQTVPKLALTRKEAAEALSVSENTVWRLASLGKIVKTSYGTYPVASLNQHLENEMKRAQR